MDNQALLDICDKVTYFFFYYELLVHGSLKLLVEDRSIKQARVIVIQVKVV
jgi:hypothetical protein